MRTTAAWCRCSDASARSTRASSAAQTTPQERAAFVERLRITGKLSRAGEALLEVLDKALTAEKAEMLGKVLAYCIAAEISWADCERMCEMVTAAYLDDLRYFARTDPGDIGETGDEVEHLIALGFYVRDKTRFGTAVMSGVQPIPSTYGAYLLRALRD